MEDFNNHGYGVLIDIPSSDEEEESSDDEYYEQIPEQFILYYAQVKRKIENNDPSLTELHIGPGYYCPQYRSWETELYWGVDGENIGKHTQIKKLTYSDQCPDGRFDTFDGKELSFFQGVSSNRSIETLHFTRLHDYQFKSGEVFNVLIPFFRNNPNLKRLHLDNCEMSQRCVDALTRALLEFNSLIEFRFCWINPGNSGCLDFSFMSALSGHLNMERLDLRGNGLGHHQCKPLATMLQHPASKLTELWITCHCLDGPGWNEW